MIFCPNNLITEANCTVNGESTNFPKENMLSDRLVERTYFEDYIDIDLGSAVNIDVATFLASEECQLLANSSPSWTSPPFALPLSNTVNLINQTYRYWRIVVFVQYGVNYVNGNDVYLDFPSGTYRTPSNLVPIDINGTGAMSLRIGSNYWELASGIGAGTSKVWFDDTGSSTYGPIVLSGGGDTWVNLATNVQMGVDSVNGGLVTWNLPRYADGDVLGGLFDFYFLASAWSYAFIGSTPDIYIAQNGSVYKTSVSNSNLVVRWDGQTGPAGSATPDVTEDIQRGSGSAKVGHVLLGNRLVFPDPNYGSIPKYQNNDIENLSRGYQRYKTTGQQRKVQEFEFTTVTKEKYDLLKAHFTSSDRNNPGYFAQTEDDLDLFEPYFAQVEIDFGDKYHGDRYRLKAKVEELK
ncbi:MAG: hypothetical protein GWN64_07975 [Candidatus Thorarchaeota archaeon]|nr:hypothetical protein [Candidatus Thorarchaeota archaeon]